MKPLPIEDYSSTKVKNKKKHFPKPKNKLDNLKVKVKKISKRLNQYAESDNIKDSEVMKLLQDTRNQVLSLHIQRKEISKQNKKNKRRN